MPHTVQLSNEAYALLKSLKGPAESFSDTVTRLAARGKDPRLLRNLRVRDDFDLDALICTPSPWRMPRSRPGWHSASWRRARFQAGQMSSSLASRPTAATLQSSRATRSISRGRGPIEGPLCENLCPPTLAAKAQPKGCSRMNFCAAASFSGSHWSGLANIGRWMVAV